MSKKQQQEFNQMLREMRQYVEDTDAALVQSRDSVGRMRERFQAIKIDTVEKQEAVINTEVKVAKTAGKADIKAAAIAHKQETKAVEVAQTSPNKDVFDPLAPVSVKVTSFGPKKDKDLPVKTTQIAKKTKSDTAVKSTQVKVKKKPYNGP